MKISLIIPAYNEEKYISACLESVAKNGAGLFEIMVVDNGSTDATLDAVRLFPNVRVVKEASKGVTKARERGFIESKGDIVAFIDADTKLPAGWVDLISDIFSKNPKVVCLSGPYIYEDVSLIARFSVRLYYLLARPIYHLLGYMATSGNLAARKSALIEINGFDTSIDFYGDDTSIAKQLHKVGKVLFLKKFCVHTSPRRFNKEGTLRTGYRYFINFFSIVFFGKPISKNHTDIR
ncbi:MAG TPA: glycosyltransferase family A protein [Candidatus Paceibacterota bacterium]|jgi:glycosyltransferase involved in cell wall biosynthesis|nr:glycosyltransferase family A protein [Candidatus Paceibacterota bacterium]